MAKRFNVRVYGLLIREGSVLVSDEFIKGNKVTKFPGGGLQFGEGTKDCIVREFREELNVQVDVTRHFYTTDFYVASAFDSNSQVISIYYVVKQTCDTPVTVSDRPHDYEKKEGAQSLRWIALDKLSEKDFTLIIDRKVGEMLGADVEVY